MWLSFLFEGPNVVGKRECTGWKITKVWQIANFSKQAIVEPNVKLQFRSTVYIMLL